MEYDKEEAEFLIENFKEEYGNNLLDLVYYLSISVAFTSELVHFVRLNFFLPKGKLLSYSNESKFLFSKLCIRISDNLYEVEKNVKLYLIKDFDNKFGKNERLKLASLLWQYNKRFLPWEKRQLLEKAQELTVLNFFLPEKAQEVIKEIQNTNDNKKNYIKNWAVAIEKEIKNTNEIIYEANIKKTIINIYKDVNFNINLKEIIDKLNKICKYLKFREGSLKIILNDEKIVFDSSHKKVQEQLRFEQDNKSILFTIYFTEKKYTNNYFYEIYNDISIFSFNNWNKLTDSSIVNFAIYLIAMKISSKIDDFRHKDSNNCIFDFLNNKTQIDNNIKSAYFCDKCLERLNKNINEKNKPLIEDLKSILLIQKSIYEATNKNLKQIPDEIFSMLNLEKLDLSINKINKIDEKVFKLEKLKEIYFQYNILENFPISNFELPVIKNIEVLDIGGNKIKSIPKEIENLVNLKSLKIGRNELKEIPDELYNLKNLEILYLGENDLGFISPKINQLTKLKELYLNTTNLKEIPIELFDLENLEILLLNSNNLENIPKEIEKLKNLKELHLANNIKLEIPFDIINDYKNPKRIINFIIKNDDISDSVEYIRNNENLTSFPEEVFNIINLQKLDLSKNKISKLPSSISKLKNLKSINLSENELMDLPNELTELTNLEEIYLNKNRIYQLPNGMNKLKNLKKIFLFNNHLNEIPNEIFKIESLEVLYLNLNYLNKIPNKISKLKNIRIINLSNNQLTEIPDELYNLKNLEILYLGKNDLGFISPKINQLTKLKKLDINATNLKEIPLELFELKNLEILLLNYNNLENIPKEIEKLKNLKEIYLYKNQIKEIPTEIASLSNLTTLYSHNNRIKEIPTEIASLSNLTTLYSHKNQIKEIPTEISSLLNLKFINLSNNQIKEIPTEISSLLNLEFINLSNNQIKEIPTEISSLLNLKFINLSNNQIKEIPPEISSLLNLELLDLSNNQIKEIPTEISSLLNLKFINLSNNQIDYIPKHILETNNPQKIFKFFEDIGLDISIKYITPAIIKSGWKDKFKQETFLAKTRRKADYVLYYNENLPISVIEVKSKKSKINNGIKQALEYAEILDIPFAFATSGDNFLFHDKTIKDINLREKIISLSEFPTPNELWEKYQNWKNSYKDNIFNLENDLKKSYSEILNEEDVSYGNIIRKKFYIKLPEGLSKLEVENNIKFAINEYLKDKKNINALAIFVCKETDSELDIYTIARAFFAPYGNWDRSNEFKSYLDNKLTIDYEESYLKNNQKINYFIELNKNIKDSSLYLKIKTNFPDKTKLLITVSRSYFIGNNKKKYLNKFIDKDYTIKNGEIYLNIDIDDNLWYKKLLKKIDENPSVLSKPEKINDYIDINILFSTLRHQENSVLNILGFNGEFISGKGAKIIYGKTVFEKNKTVKIPFNITDKMEDEILDNPDVQNYIKPYFEIQEQFYERLIFISTSIKKYFEDNKEFIFEDNYKIKNQKNGTLLLIKNIKSEKTVKIYFEQEINNSPNSYSNLYIKLFVDNNEQEIKIIKFKNGSINTNNNSYIEVENEPVFISDIGNLKSKLIKLIKNTFKNLEKDLIYNYKKILKDNFKALAVVTDGRNLEINENGLSQTGIWKISEDRIFDKVIVFHKDNGQNKIYIGDYSHREIVEDRYNIFFTNTKFVGLSAVNWTDFCEKEGSGFSICYLP
ncbi:MAG: leucine-rich repeat domain-containing protein [Candidatus Sericytochromatia bacterium]